jgi:hypothetical protein
VQVGSYTVVVDGSRIELLRQGVLVGAGRWTGRRIEDCLLELEPDVSEHDDAREDRLGRRQALFAEIEARLAAEEAAAVEAMHASFYNEDGVDLREIVWTLGLTHGERLREMEEYVGPRFRSTLEILVRHRVDFMVIGGVAANLLGASFTTKDLDILYSRKPENIARLMSALAELDAVFNDLAGRRIVPNESYLVNERPKLLRTRFGMLDVLGTLSMEDDATNYEDVLGDSVVLDLGGLAVRVLRLEKIIEVKTKAGRPKDVAVLPLLRAALEEARKRG